MYTYIYIGGKPGLRRQRAPALQGLRLLVYQALSYSLSGLKLLVYEAFKLPVYEALSY
jgi:hypothetical protein